MRIYVSKTAPVDIFIKRKDFFYLDIQILTEDESLTPVDFSYYDFAIFQVRENESSDAVLSLSSTGGTIDISNRSNGQFVFSGFTDTVQSNTYYFDFELSKGSKRQTTMSGTFVVENDYAE